MYELPMSKISVIIKRKTMNTIFNIAIVAPIMEIQFRNDCGSFISLYLFNMLFYVTLFNCFFLSVSLRCSFQKVIFIYFVLVFSFPFIKNQRF